MPDIRLTQGESTSSNIRLTDINAGDGTSLGWFAAFTQPVRRVGSAVALVVASGLFAPVVPPVEGHGTSTPYRSGGLTPQVQSFQYPSVQGPPPFDVALDWLPVQAQPVRRAVVVLSGSTMPVPFEATAETITLDNWHSPLSQPVRRTVGRQPEALAWNSFTPSQLPFDWFAGLAQPILRKGIGTAQQDPVAFVAVVDTSPTAGTGTSVPYRAGGLPPQAQSFQYPSVQGPVPVVDASAPTAGTGTSIPYQTVNLPSQVQGFQYPSVQAPIPPPLAQPAPRSAAGTPYQIGGLPPQITSFQYPSHTHVLPWLSTPVLLWDGNTLDAKPDADFTFDGSASTGAIVTEQISSDAGFSSIYTTLTHTLTAPEVAAGTADLTWTDPSLVDGTWYMRAQITDGGVASPWSNTETITIAASAAAGTGTDVPYRISAGLPPQVRVFQYPSVQAPTPVVAEVVWPPGVGTGTTVLSIKDGLPPRAKRFQRISRETSVISWLSAPVLLWNPVTSDATPDFDITFDLSAGVGATITWQIATDTGFVSIVAAYSDTLTAPQVLAGLVQGSATTLSNGTYYARGKITDGGMDSPWSNTEVVTITATTAGAGVVTPYTTGGLPPQIKTFQYPCIASPVPLVPIETVTLDKWFEPLAQPTRRVRSVAPQPALAWSTFAPQSFDWFRPLSVPTRRIRAIAPSSLLWSSFTPNPDGPQLDKWFQPLSPAPRRRSSVASQPSFDWNSSTPARDAPGLDKWFEPLSVPTRRTRAIAPSSLLWSTFTPAPVVEVTGLDKWFEPLSVPTRRRLSVASQPSLNWSTFTPAPSFDWCRPLSLPVRRVKAVIPPPSLLWSTFTPARDAPGLDKWFRPLEGPVRVRRGLSTPDQEFLFLIKAAPFEGEDDQGQDENRGGSWWQGEHYDHLGKAHRKRKAEKRAIDKRILQTIARAYNELKGIVEDAPEGLQDELQAEVAAIIQPAMLAPVVELPQASYIDFGLLAERTQNIEAILAQMLEEIRLRIEDEEEDDDLLLFA